MIDVSIVVITWNMSKLLSQLLSTVKNFTDGLKYEIIIIDNNSVDDTISMIETNYPDVILIQNDKNRGVAPARNQGLKIAKGDYILILDADMELVENSISKLFDFMEDKKNCGLVGSKLIDTHGNLQYSCKRFPTFLSLIYRRLENFDFVKNSKIYKNHIMADLNHNDVKKVDYVIGACQFFRRKIIEQIGFYDENIFYGPEDLDFCLRVWKAGWDVYYFPFTKIIHHEQRITKKNIFSAITLKHIKGILYIFGKYKGKLTRY